MMLSLKGTQIVLGIVIGYIVVRLMQEFGVI